MAQILIVDDEAAIADLVEICLKNEGYQVHKCYNAMTRWTAWPAVRWIWRFWT